MGFPKLLASGKGGWEIGHPNTIITRSLFPSSAFQAEFELLLAGFPWLTHHYQLLRGSKDKK